MRSEWLWDRLSANWDKPGVGLGENDIRLIGKVKKYLGPAASVLDYGCATGSIALDLAGSVKDVRGIDISSKMIAIANTKTAERGVSNAGFTRAAIFDESLEKASFDAVLCFSTLHLIENLPQVFQRINALLKPGGFFISATPCTGEKTLQSTLIVVPLFLASRIGLLPHVNFFKVTGLSDAIARAGFRITETENLSLRPVTEAFIVAQKI
jgi:2-polyprenyl-3-methyl-5-hydroxy-6-metoxy-1,4-benzoquinol methylase